MQKKHIKTLFSDDVRSFSVYDCHRSIPSGIDGLKPAMRKIVYGMLKKFPTQEIKLSLAASGIQEVSAYHHGSLEGTMVNMAQRFIGSNNLPLLEDIGQFGSRISPVASASRYIFTRLSDIFRKIYLKDDDGILTYLEDDGMSIEPNWYLPIIPMILVNGSDGMGTGFACKVLAYNPIDVITACESTIKSKSIATLTPWYRGYTGKVTKVSGQTTFEGCYTIDNTTTLRITELPIGTFTQKYRDVLNDLEDKSLIKSYIDNSSEEKTEFVVTCPRETLRKSHDDLMKLFKLVSRETENITVWTENEKLRKFDTTESLIQWFVQYRLSMYEKRKMFKIVDLERKLLDMVERMKFIKFYLSNTDFFSKSNKSVILDRLVVDGFKNTDSLLSIKIYNLTLDQIESLKQEIGSIESELADVKLKQASDFYMEDLSNLKKFLKSSKLSV